MKKVTLAWVTPDAENQIIMRARHDTSNAVKPKNSKLISSLISRGHWSPFEMVNMCIIVKTSRAISAQIIRHRSMNFQEFSQRYSDVLDFEKGEARREDIKNKQNSFDDLNKETKGRFLEIQNEVLQLSKVRYNELRGLGVAKECARSILPMSSATVLSINGTVRSWIHYLKLRCHEATQKEHRDIANAIRDIFIKEFPTVHEALISLDSVNHSKIEEFKWE